FDPIAGIAGEAVSVLTPWTLPNYRTDATLARAVVILASVWKTLGFNILFYLAGLQTVPADIIEAGRLDGANVWQRMRYIILPSLSPITFFLIVTNLTYAFFEIFGTIDYLTAGGPVGATSDMMFSLVRAGRVNGSFGEGAAQSLVLLVLVLVVTAWQFRSTGRRVNYAA
ncbi:MAG TPA: sugar ABC transporter permease, partial [Euzebya sp.]|nr:sugar ABC transporter permease [Euzebya sp.]